MRVIVVKIVIKSTIYHGEVKPTNIVLICRYSIDMLYHERGWGCERFLVRIHNFLFAAAIAKSVHILNSCSIICCCKSMLRHSINIVCMYVICN